MHTFLCTICVPGTSEARRGVWSCGTGVADGCESLGMWVLGIELWSSGRAASVLSCWSISPVPIYWSFTIIGTFTKTMQRSGSYATFILSFMKQVWPYREETGQDRCELLVEDWVKTLARLTCENSPWPLNCGASLGVWGSLGCEDLDI